MGRRRLESERIQRKEWRRESRRGFGALEREAKEAGPCPACGQSHTVHVGTLTAEGEFVETFLCGDCGKEWT